MSARRIPLGLLILALAVTLTACVRARTVVDSSWADPQFVGQSPGSVLIVTVGGDEFAQAAFQQQMAAQLKARGVDARASGAYFAEYTQVARDRFRRVIANAATDSVLVVRLTGRDTTTANINALREAEKAGVPDAYAGFANDGSVQSDYYLTTTVTTRASLFQRASAKLIWTANTTTTNAQSGNYQREIARLVSLYADWMARDKVI